MSGMTVMNVRREGVIVNGYLVGEGVQPWSGKPCFVYEVTFSVRDAGEWSQKAYGSQVDYENGESAREEEITRMVVGELLDAYNDPEEFWQLATGEPDLNTLDSARHIIELIDYAAKAGPLLEQLEDFAREED